MAQRNIGQLPKASKRHRPSRQRSGEKGAKGFESRADAEAEDALRRLMLTRYRVEDTPPQCSFNLEDVKRLSNRIGAAVSPAPGVHMRKQRNRIGGYLYELIDRQGAPARDLPESAKQSADAAASRGEQ